MYDNNFRSACNCLIVKIQSREKTASSFHRSTTEKLVTNLPRFCMKVKSSSRNSLRLMSSDISYSYNNNIVTLKTQHISTQARALRTAKDQKYEQSKD